MGFTLGLALRKLFTARIRIGNRLVLLGTSTLGMVAVAGGLMIKALGPISWTNFGQVVFVVEFGILPIVLGIGLLVTAFANIAAQPSLVGHHRGPR